LGILVQTIPTIQTSKASKERIVSIQVCRGLAALVVILAHLYEFSDRYLKLPFTEGLRLGDIGVDIFFVISGVVISLVTLGKFGSGRNALSFLHHRFARIYPVFWIYFIVVLAVYLQNPSTVNAIAGSTPNLFWGFFLMPSPGHPLLIAQAWTLSHEVCFYCIVFLLMVTVPERIAGWCLLGWGVFMAVAKVLSFSFTNPVLSLLASPLNFEFLSGYLLFSIYRRTTLHRSAGKLILASSLVWLALVTWWSIAAHDLVHWIERDTWTRVYFWGPFAFLFVWGAMELERNRIRKIAKFFEDLGNWSYSIYLSHVLVIHAIGRPLARLLPHTFPTFLIICAATLPASIAVGALSYRFLELPLMALLYKKRDSKRRRELERVAVPKVRIAMVVPFPKANSHR
jgi:exopolysaccharide production protein ExoZ